MSLDAFRGMTIAGMLLVNNPGSWNHIYWPLDHAHWNGWTFTDLIFPFFLFIVGVAMVFSTAKRIEAGDPKQVLFAHVVRRAVVLILLGYCGAVGFFLPPSSLTDPLTRQETPLGFLASWSAVGADGTTLRLGALILFTAMIVLIVGTRHLISWLIVLALGIGVFAAGASMTGLDDPLWKRLVTSRWPGVLVRIGVCYLCASAITFATPSPKAIVTWVVALLSIYWVWMLAIPIPGHGMPDLDIPVEREEGGFSGIYSNWEVYADTHIFGLHNYQTIPPRSEVTSENPIRWGFDPEGSLSTIAAICTVLLGYLTGLWLRAATTSPAEKTVGMFVAGNWLLLIGLVMSIWFPINKKIWSSSYVVFMAGMALVILAMCYHVIDVRGQRKWIMPFVWYGTNAITAFFFSGLMATLLGRIKVEDVDEAGLPRLIGLNRHIYENLLVPWAGDINGSLVYAVGFVLLWTFLMWVLYSRRIFLRV